MKNSALTILFALSLGAISVSGQYSNTLTFQVDMSAQIAAGAFDPNTDAVWAQGSFNGWGQLVLTQGALNTNVYTGTIIDTVDANGAEMSYLFGDSQIPYETTADYNNRMFVLPATNGASLNLAYTYFDDDAPAITSLVTFRVDMSGEMSCGNFTPGNNTVEVQGGFEGWNSGLTMTNDPSIIRTNYAGVVSSNVYVLTLPVDDATNAANDFKYVIQPNYIYETPAATNQDTGPGGGNRWFINSGNQALPVVYFNDVPIYDSITFEVDMTVQMQSGNFSLNNGNTVEIHGDFNGWSYGQTMTNNPFSGTPNIFSTVITYAHVPGAEHYFQYVIQPGLQWEDVSPANSAGGARHFNLGLTNGNFTNGPVYFSDESTSAYPLDFVTVDNCMVTFTVDMTAAINSFAFSPCCDEVDLNGLYNGVNDSFWTWGFFDAPPSYAMTQIGESSLYTITLPVNLGQSLDLIYKYGIDGLDNEAGFLDNHARWVRSLPNYTMPVDTFGSQGTSTQSEVSFGNLAISPAGSGAVQLSWTGRDGVHLQTTSSLKPSAVWTNLNLTDGTNLPVGAGGMASTNYPTAQGNRFYRLVGPQ